MLLLIILPSLWTSGQLPIPSHARLSNFRQKKIPVADTVLLDTISIVPKTLALNGIPDSDYHFDFVKAILYWHKKPPVDSVLITYRVFPFKLNPVAQHLNYDSISKIPFIIPLTFTGNNPGALSKGMLSKGALSKGALSKGMLSKGALSKGALSKGMLSKGALSKGALSKGMLSKGALSKGALSKGMLSKGALSKGALS